MTPSINDKPKEVFASMPNEMMYSLTEDNKLESVVIGCDLSNVPDRTISFKLENGGLYDSDGNKIMDVYKLDD